MSKYLKATVICLGAGLLAAAAQAEKLGLGRAATPDEVAAWDIDVRPDGLGLPDGSGDVATGEEIYTERCASCHGVFGEGEGRWPVLAGGQGTLTSARPVKTVGSYWPYLSTVWDYVHRAMPFGEAQSLQDDEVYAVTAYLLYLNDLVDDDFVLSRENFTEIRLPNEPNFIPDNRPESPVFASREVCMTDCKAEVTITKRAAVLDVTPESEGGSLEGDEASAPESATEAPAETQVAAAEPAALDDALVASGEKVFKKCKACHQVGDGAKNRTGPMLNGIMGAPVGAVDGFKYSKIFQQKHDEGLVWDETTLDAFLEKPKNWAKGTRMSFAGLRKEEDRQAVIEYLKSVSQ